MNDCRVCGTPDEKKPMTFRGTGYCSEMHHKILEREFGTDVGRLLEMNLITQDEAVRLSSTKPQKKIRTHVTKAGRVDEHYLLSRPKPGEK